MPIGARVLKTGIAVTLAIAICRLVGIEQAAFAAITVVVNMQPSVQRALKNAWEQIIVNITAVVLAIAFGFFLGNQAWVIGLAVILMIMIANKVGWGGITVGIVSIIFILDAPQGQFLQHAGVRSLAIFIGLFVALIINRLLAPPKYKQMLKTQLVELLREASDYFLQSLRTFANSSELESFQPTNIDHLEKKLGEVRKTHQFAREELNERDNPVLLERLLELCRGLVERGQIIENMTHERIKRRQSPDAPVNPKYLSPEFSRVLQLLNTGADRVEVQRDLVLKGLNEPHSLGPKGNDREFWAEFDQALSAWQRNVSGEFFLRAMMEVVVVASEMRWAFRRMRTIYNLSSTGDSESDKVTKYI